MTTKEIEAAATQFLLNNPQEARADHWSFKQGAKWAMEAYADQAKSQQEAKNEAEILKLYKPSVYGSYKNCFVAGFRAAEEVLNLCQLKPKQ